MLHLFAHEPAPQTPERLHPEPVTRLASLRNALRVVDDFGGGPAPDLDDELSELWESAGGAARRCFDRRSAELFELYLSGAGYGVQVASDGAEGLELARALRPRAVILDILLPRLDGWDLLARLKADPATADCPVVVVSMLDAAGGFFGS